MYYRIVLARAACNLSKFTRIERGIVLLVKVTLA